MDIDYSDLKTVLDWVVFKGGAAAVAAWFVSWGLEEFAFWHKLASKAKQLIILAVTVLIGLGAYGFMQFPEAIEIVGPWFGVIALPVIAWLSSQTFYKLGGKK